MKDPAIMAAILCGGASRRMGQDKARLPHPSGGTLLERAAALVADCCEETVLLSGDGRRYPELGLTELADAKPDCGPLGGLVAALRRAGERGLLLLPVDMAGLTGEDLTVLIDGFHAGDEPVLARGPERRHPALSIWTSSSRRAAETALAAGRLALHALLDQLEARELDLPDAALVNWNRPGDLER